MKILTKIASIIFMSTAIESLEFYNSTPSITWLTTSLDKFESSIPIPHHQDTFDVLVDESLYSLAFLTWKDENEFLPKLFKLTVKTRSFDGKIHSKVCDVQPPSVHENGWTVPKSVTYLRSGRVLLSWQGGSKIHETEDSQTIFQVIFTNTCQSSRYSTIKSPKDSVSGPGIIIVKFKNTYDVIFHQSTMSPVTYFKWSFDHYGRALHRTPEALAKYFPEVNKFAHITSAFPLSNTRDEGYVFVGKGIDHQNIYSSSSGWLIAEKIYHSDHAFSNSSGFATICWKLKLKPGSNRIRCECLEETCARDYSLSVRNQVSHHFEEFSIYNTPDGRVLLLAEIFNIANGEALLVVDEAQSDGKCRRLGVVELPGNLDRIESSTSDRERYCFFFVTHVFSPRPRLNQFTTKCIQMPDNASGDRVACGAIDYRDSFARAGP